MDTPNGTVGLGPIVDARSGPSLAPSGARAKDVGSLDHAAAELQLCAALSLGTPIGPGSHRFDRVLDVAIAERCAPLAWLRSESVIRASASAPVVERWQSEFEKNQRRTERHLATLAEVMQWLEAHEISPIILKGAPLGMRLYGNPAARVMNDIDLFVSAEESETADTVLRATGWLRLRGMPPEDIEYVKDVAGEPLMLELHSTLAGPWLADVPVTAPDSRRIMLAGGERRAMDGAMVPAYLASHLLQHSERPMMWAIDFTTLWTRLSEAERVAAGEHARAVRLGGALVLAERWASMTTASAIGSLDAAAALEREVLRPGPWLWFRQILSAAASISDAWHVLLQLMWPRAVRGDVPGVIRLWSERVTRRLARIAHR